MIQALSNMYTKTLGPWSLWLFGIGAFAILYSSSVAAIAAGARHLADYLIELGFTPRHRVDLRRAIIRWYCLVVPFAGLGLYAGFQRPVLMVTIAACYAAMMLPIQSAITMYLQAKTITRAGATEVACPVLATAHFRGATRSRICSGLLHCIVKSVKLVS